MITQRRIFKEHTSYGLAVSKTRETIKSVLNRRLNDAAFKENKKATRQLEAFIAGVGKR